MPIDNPAQWITDLIIDLVDSSSQNDLGLATGEKAFDHFFYWTCRAQRL